MFVTLIYKDADFHKYKISETADIMKDGEIINESDCIYHSTNGHDYVLVETVHGRFTMYPLDKVVYNSFYPETQNRWEHFRIIHIDGNLRNNNLDNLRAEEEFEEWKIVTHPDFPKDEYEVSSWGNIRKTDGTSVTVSMAGGISKFQDKPNKRQYTVSINSSNKTLHRIIAYTFMWSDITSDDCINHIDNNSHNNSLDNLEIVSKIDNTRHALFIKALPGYVRPDWMIHTFCELYVRNNGDISKTKLELCEMGLGRYFSDRYVSKLIRKQAFQSITDLYFKTGDFKLPRKPFLSSKEVEDICIALLKNDGSTTRALTYLRNNNNERISLSDIKKIRYKYQFKNISDRFFRINNDNRFTPIKCKNV